MAAFRPVRTLTRLAEDLLPGSAPRPSRVYNPARADQRPERAEPTIFTIFSYDAFHVEEQTVMLQECCGKVNGMITWINADGLKKEEVEHLSNQYRIHPLLVEDILHVGQRSKMDEISETIFCVLPMLYYNENTAMVEAEQVSLVLVDRTVLSFQEDAKRDVFTPVRTRLRTGEGGKLRSSGADYLLYNLIDVIVDSYFGVLERLDARAESLEDAILRNDKGATSARIALLRREIVTTLRAISPVRDLLAGLLRSDNPLLTEAIRKYFKDVQDHIVQAVDSAESLRDVTSALQELAMNQVNMRTNEVVKTFTIITTLLAPATVIGGIFGMNFDVIPLAHQKDGFFVMVSLMFIIPVFMLIWFKRKGWF
jgi:magnesium transporter